MTDRLRRAYATLGLPSGASPGQVRRRYRFLVKTWHPDRFAQDPTGQAEAGEHLAHINTAYHVVMAHGGEQPAAVPEGTRLTREQIDGLVRAIGPDSPLDWLLGRVERFTDQRTKGKSIWAQPGKIAVALSVALGFVVLHSRYGHWPTDAIVWSLIVLASAGSRLWRRRAVEQADEPDKARFDEGRDGTSGPSPRVG